MDYNLSEMKLLVQGGEADLYEVDDRLLLRVLRRANDHEDSVKELYHILESHQVKIPKIYEYGLVDEKQAEIMERIHGRDMLEQFVRNPLQLKKNALAFSKLHQKILHIEEPCNLATLDERFKWFVTQKDILEPEVMKFVQDLFEKLPKGNAICHSDFHPGNILLQDGMPYIIDMAHAYIGNRISDIAHTYLILSYVPNIPGQGAIKLGIIKHFGKKLAKYYFAAIKEEFQFDLSEFSKWTVIMASLRICYGLPSEKNERIQYVCNCYHLHKQGIDPTTWYEKI